MKLLNKIALVLVLIGAVNWGLIGLFKLDLVAAVFGGMQSLISRIIYSLVGLAGFYLIYIKLAKIEKQPFH
jgi:uncharacterized membrane protein YuzA (DUF378 family)